MAIWSEKLDFSAQLAGSRGRVKIDMSPKSIFPNANSDWRKNWWSRGRLVNHSREKISCMIPGGSREWFGGKLGLLAHPASLIATGGSRGQVVSNATG
jgi:hypothetical protein